MRGRLAASRDVGTLASLRARAAVDDAIATVARNALRLYAERGIDEPTFTTAAVWAKLGEGFPVTKGIAGRMRRMGPQWCSPRKRG